MIEVSEKTLSEGMYNLFGIHMYESPWMPLGSNSILATPHCF